MLNKGLIIKDPSLKQRVGKDALTCRTCKRVMDVIAEKQENKNGRQWK